MRLFALPDDKLSSRAKVSKKLKATNHFDQEATLDGIFLVDGVGARMHTIGREAKASQQKPAKSPFCASFCAATP